MHPPLPSSFTRPLFLHDIPSTFSTNFRTKLTTFLLPFASPSMRTFFFFGRGLENPPSSLFTRATGWRYRRPVQALPSRTGVKPSTCFFSSSRVSHAPVHELPPILPGPSIPLPCTSWFPPTSPPGRFLSHEIRPMVLWREVGFPLVSGNQSLLSPHFEPLPSDT